MERKIKVGVLFGGQSSEHEIALLSAQNIVQGLSPKKYEVTLIAIDKQGEWHWYKDPQHYLNHPQDPKKINLSADGQSVTITPNQAAAFKVDGSPGHQLPVDVIFPVLHGPMGEDGTVQGLLRLLNIPFVGAGVLGSAIGMDKDVMKRLLKEAGIPIGPFITLHQYQQHTCDLAQVIKTLGLPLFVKPANAGSSIGVTKVTHTDQLAPAIHKAFLYDRKVLIEAGIVGREIECAVLGNQQPEASLPGELIPTHDFYSYEAKYLDDNGARFSIPVALPADTQKRIQQLATQAFQVLCCEGMARVDFFLTPDNQILINEINTIPGFTRISMYPKLWEVSGVPYGDLLDRLIELAFARHQEEVRLQAEILGVAQAAMRA